MAVVGAHRWEEVVELFTAGAAVLQSETRYFESSEMHNAWLWARTAKHAEDAPVHVISPATGIWKDYRPEFVCRCNQKTAKLARRIASMAIATTFLLAAMVAGYRT